MEASQFTEFLRRNAGLVHRIARSYGRDAADREDLAQAIVLQLWRARARYDARYRETTWVYRVALNVAISFQRQERRHRERRVSADAALISVAAPAAAEPGAEVQLLQRCIDELGALEKALVLLYLDGNDHASIADVLGLSVSNVGTKLQRIKETLRVALEARARAEGKERPHAAR